MTAMRLKRYPSPSGGIALGKMGVGATLLRSVLPAGARWVEYLASTGTEVLDTGYIPVDGDVLAFPANALFGNGGSIDGCITATRRRLHNFNTLVAVYVGNSAYNIARAGAVWNYDSEWRIDLSRHTLTFGDTTIPFSSDASLPDVSFCFLARHNNMSGSPIYDNHRAGSRFRYFKVYRNQEAVCDFRPIAIGNTGYMLDLVSGEHLPYGNKGTGDFVIGPDINAPAI